MIESAEILMSKRGNIYTDRRTLLQATLWTQKASKLPELRWATLRGRRLRKIGIIPFMFVLCYMFLTKKHIHNSLLEICAPNAIPTPHFELFPPAMIPAHFVP